MDPIFFRLCKREDFTRPKNREEEEKSKPSAADESNRIESNRIESALRNPNFPIESTNSHHVIQTSESHNREAKRIEAHCTTSHCRIRPFVMLSWLKSFVSAENPIHPQHQHHHHQIEETAIATPTERDELNKKSDSAPSFAVTALSSSPPSNDHASSSSSSSSPSPSSSSSSTDLSAPSTSPVGGFWGHTTTDVRADADPALDDIMSFFGFAHKEETSDYTGCVSFELTYPDGEVAIRTVEIKPKPIGKEPKVTIEEIVDGANGDATPHTRVARVDSVPMFDSSDHTTTLQHRASKYLRPICRLVRPTIQTIDAQSTVNNSAPAPTLARLPFSSRVHIYHGPVPSDVRPTARLLCPRSVFFDVYQGRLDPVTSVLTGRARCPGWRYYELMHFGQSFDMKPETWVKFYQLQEEIEKKNKNLLQPGGSTR